MPLRRIVSAAALALLAACATTPPPTAQPPAAAVAPLRVPVEALNPDVRQDTIGLTICVAGYTASVRPSTTYTNGVKAKLLRERGLPATAADDYELDHRVPLALGGHPRALVNLMLQPWEGDDGAKKKDRLERRLQTLVCTGKVGLDEARAAVYLDWQAAYRTFVKP